MGQMKETEIDGRPVVVEFKVPAWDCDPYGWVTDDGRIWHTSHGCFVEINEEYMLHLMAEPLESIRQIQSALLMVRLLRKTSCCSGEE